MQNINMIPKGGMSLQETYKVTTPHQAKKVAQDYEAQFLTYMLRDMFAGVEGAWGEGHAGEMIKSFWIDATAKACAEKGIGIGKILYKELVKKNKIQDGKSYEQRV